MIGEGDKVPALSCAASDGTTRQPGRSRPRSWSSISIPRTIRRAAPARRRISPRWPASSRRPGVKVVGVSRDPMKKHDKFIAKYDLKVPLASDEDGAICEAFGTWVEKSMYGRKYMGIERATFLIDPDGRVVSAWRKVKVPGHAAEVLKAASG